MDLMELLNAKSFVSCVVPVICVELLFGISPAEPRRLPTFELVIAKTSVVDGSSPCKIVNWLR